MLPPGEYEGKDLFIDLLTNDKVINLSTSLYRKNIISKMISQYPEIMKGENSVFEDLQIILSCASSGKIVVLPEVVFQYRVGFDSVSHQKSIKRRYHYRLKSFEQQRLLRKFFIKETTSQQERRLSDYYKRKGDDLASLAFRIGPDNRENLLVSVPFGKYVSSKGKLYLLLMRNRFLWKLLQALWKELFPTKFKSL